MRSITAVIPQEIINQDKEMYACDFSEGNKSLEKCLRIFWDDGFETIGCCSGHDIHKAYIGFRFNDKTIKLLSNIKKQNVKITFVILLNKKSQKMNFTIKEIDNDNMFDDILKTYDSNKEIDENIKVVVDFISKGFEGYVNVRMLYKEKLVIYLVTDNLKLIDYFLNMNREFVHINKNLYSFKVNINDLKEINF